MNINPKFETVTLLTCEKTDDSIDVAPKVAKVMAVNIPNMAIKSLYIPVFVDFIFSSFSAHALKLFLLFGLIHLYIAFGLMIK